MKLWSGRFKKELDERANAFNSSIALDRRMYGQDIEGSIAHAAMLGGRGIIEMEESRAIIEQLKRIKADIGSGAIEIDESAEDIHTFIEALLTERLGGAGGRLHTARSRNDQVALDMRLYLREQIGEIAGLIKNLIRTIIKLAKEHTQTIMPGYTHLQRAQPVTFAHHVLAYAQMLRRDMGRLEDCKARMDLSPLGAGALAGTTYDIDREGPARALGFGGVTENSMDSVSDRDFVIELASALSIVMMHMSRFSEEIILWSSAEFGYVELDDAYSTGSSIMPQKKNPDIAELVRGKTGRVYGDLMALLTIMKGLPLAYNKDMQEDKEAVFDAVDTVKACLEVFAAMLGSLTVRKERMYENALGGFINATDCADFLVKRGVPFRQAYRAVGKLVAKCCEEGKTLETLPLEQYRQAHPAFDEGIFAALELKGCVDGRDVRGGTGKGAVMAQIEQLERYMKELEDKAL